MAHKDLKYVTQLTTDFQGNVNFDPTFFCYTQIYEFRFLVLQCLRLFRGRKLGSIRAISLSILKRSMYQKKLRTLDRKMLPLSPKSRHYITSEYLCF